MKTIKESKFLSNLYEEFKEEIPNNLFDLSIYKIFENFKDYEYIYCIAYEMLIRTEEYNNLLNEYDNLVKKLKDITGIELFDKILELTSQMNLLGLSKNSFIGFDCGNGNIFEKIKKYKEILESPWSVRTIDKFIIDKSMKYQDIYEALIYHYHSIGELYILKNDTDDEYIKTNIDPINALFYQNEIYIPCNNKDKKEIQFKLLTSTIYLKELDENFLKTLKEEKNKDLLINIARDDNDSLNNSNINKFGKSYIQTETLFSRPKILFDDAKLINLPMNLNLSKEELLLLISKVKDEYDDNKNIVRNSLESIFNLVLINDNTEIPANIKHVNDNSKTTKRLFPNTSDVFKKNISKAFYIYDLYKFFTSCLKNKRKLIREKRRKKIELIKKETKEDRERVAYKEIRELRTSTQGELKRYENDKLLKEIVHLSGLSKEQVEYYLTMMKEFIHGVNLRKEKDHLKKVNNPEVYQKSEPKYKDLIIGNSHIIKHNKTYLIKKLMD